jgi:hypothetical protein
MPRGPAPGWRARKQPVLDQHILAAVTAAGGVGKHRDGHYGQLVIDGFTSQDEAKEWSRALYRSAAWMHRNGVAPVSVSVRLERDGTGHRLVFDVFDKTHARGHILDKHGADRSRWPYDARRKVTTP